MSVIDQSLVAEFRSSAIVSERYEEKREERLAITTIQHRIEGNLADRIRKVMSAGKTAPVSITTIEHYWIEDDNEDNGRSEHTWVVQCGTKSEERKSTSHTGALASVFVWLEMAK